MFPRTIKNVNTWYFHTKTSTPIDCLSTYFYRSLVRKTVCFGLNIDKTCVIEVFSESPLNTDTRIVRTLWHVPFVSVLTGFHCTINSNRVHVPPPPGKTPGHLTFLKTFGQIPWYVGSLDGQKCLALQKASNPPPTMCEIVYSK